MLDTVNALLTQNKIPSLDEIQMSGLLNYLFTAAKKTVRNEVAEVVYRYDHDHPQALNLFLACALPLAEKLSRARAYRTFACPSAWQMEVMYDGAVDAVIRMFQRNSPVELAEGKFRSYLLRVVAQGGLHACFSRQETTGVQGVSDLAKVRPGKKHRRNYTEEAFIARDLLDRVTNFPHLRPEASAILQCIGRLGPHGALKSHAYSPSGNPEIRTRPRIANPKRPRTSPWNPTPILDPIGIAEALGTDTYTVHHYLRQARVILREAFNADGKLFLTR